MHNTIAHQPGKTMPNPLPSSDPLCSNLKHRSHTANPRRAETQASVHAWTQSHWTAGPGLKQLILAEKIIPVLNKQSFEKSKPEKPASTTDHELMVGNISLTNLDINLSAVLFNPSKTSTNWSKISKDKLWNLPNVWSCQVSKRKGPGQESRKQCYLCGKPLLSLWKKVFIQKVLLKPSTSEQLCLGGKRLEVPSLGTGGPKPPTPRAGTKELSDEACRSREPSPPFLLYHISFLAHGPSFQCAKMKQGGAQSSRFLWALES